MFEDKACEDRRIETGMAEHNGPTDIRNFVMGGSRRGVIQKKHDARESGHIQSIHKNLYDGRWDEKSGPMLRTARDLIDPWRTLQGTIE